ncbi:phosphatase PAP2 family protein [Tenacibaculum dicentrarchi]|uniref:Phosphoesterase n=1 Tax=Tenacibaculum dicentrarchi TaxID=669041 RepID=A0ABP1EF32_9FLAO|nr:phosphatase PAP2 family protein [Tenacibaculum dicentrarchi]MCD8415874.1 phosphatase PAP2 family protein [Tenacibaculum dicentrarchi]MCD8420998.1 phosphatase PAP2 family protein [Tenacibaculum dicentrarchi]MCD8435782.1 phosphatase PAP2 family protein [Tenacibaculum dicentrarchi]MCD8438168.1 phosphatase PAP2 family protein [Tenacibaculum dicentrarchi]
MEDIIQKDQALLIYLNNLGSEQWDWLWLGITNQFNWIPLFAYLIFLIFKHLGWKKTLFTLVFIAILITFSDQLTNAIRLVFERLRPNRNPLIQNSLRRLINPGNFSFVSGHATTSTVVTVFLIILLKKHVPSIKYLVFFPLVFAYSRLYLGVHFPIDIFCGFINGLIIGFLSAKLHQFLSAKIFREL